MTGILREGAKDTAARGVVGGPKDITEDFAVVKSGSTLAHYIHL